jgi:hypothetical protein
MKLREPILKNVAVCFGVRLSLTVRDASAPCLSNTHGGIEADVSTYLASCAALPPTQHHQFCVHLRYSSPGIASAATSQ